MKYFRRFILMLQFFTTLPVKFNLNVKEEDFGKGLVFAPAVGLVLGGLLAAAYYLLIQVFPVTVTAILLVIIYILITGGLHLDGLGDTFDGLFSNRSRERMLEIMRDSRVGTNAVLAVASVLILNTAVLASIKPEAMIKALVLMPVAGRIGSLAGAAVSDYARSGEGLGKSFIDYCGLKEFIIGSVIYFAVFGLTGGPLSVIIAVMVLLFTILLVKFFSRKIGGATGDILGAVCELNQTFYLLIFILVQKLEYLI